MGTGTGAPTLQNMGNPTGDGTQDLSSQNDRPPWVTVESFKTSREWYMPGPFLRNLDLNWEDGDTATRVERIEVPPMLVGPHGYTRTETTTWPADHWVPSLKGSKLTVWDDGTPSPETANDIAAPKFHWESCSVAHSQPVSGIHIGDVGSLGSGG